MSGRVDFSSNAAIYDRGHQPLLPRGVVTALASAAELKSGSRVLDVGAGTGRAALALADYACSNKPFHPGARTEGDVDAYLDHLELIRTGQWSARPGPAGTLRNFISQVASGEVSYIWNVPEEIRRRCLPRFTSLPSRQATRLWRAKSPPASNPELKQ